MAKLNEVLIIGLDGATFGIINPLVNAGKLPTIGRMIRQGCQGVLRSVNNAKPNTELTPSLTGVKGDWTRTATGVR